jgi:outer membrane protein OmpA-like peptidoglycan-associated protein
MRIVVVRVALVAALAAACSHTAADVAAPNDGLAGPGERPCPDERRAVERPQRASDASDEPPLTVSGIVLSPTFSAQCKLPATPRVFFEFDSADLDGRDVEVLRRVAKCLAEGPLRGSSVELVGRADPRGPDRYNELLGRSRADSVRDYLRDQGVPESNMVVRVSGEGLADPLWPRGWSFDRRVDIRLLR